MISLRPMAPVGALSRPEQISTACIPRRHRPLRCRRSDSEARLPRPARRAAPGPGRSRGRRPHGAHPLAARAAPPAPRCPPAGDAASKASSQRLRAPLHPPPAPHRRPALHQTQRDADPRLRCPRLQRPPRAQPRGAPRNAPLRVRQGAVGVGPGAGDAAADLRPPPSARPGRRGRPPMARRGGDAPPRTIRPPPGGSGPVLCLLRRGSAARRARRARCCCLPLPAPHGRPALRPRPAAASACRPSRSATT
jgi:hypothetical protein